MEIGATKAVQDRLKTTKIAESKGVSLVFCWDTHLTKIKGRNVLFIVNAIGRKIINTLEQDEFYVRATRIEIPASITATEFYRKFGYDYKNGVKELDEEHHYRLEKFKEAGQ